MGQMTNSFRPPHAIIMWSDDNNVYVELPMKDKSLPGYVMKFPLNEGGLSQALNLLRKPRESIRPTAAQPANYTIPHHPAVKSSPARDKLYAETTEAQRESARAVLAKLGIK